MSLRSRIEALELEAEARRRVAALPAQLPFAEWLEAVTPAFDWDAPHLIHIREHLARVTTGEIRRLLILCPPRHGKSELVTIRYPAWTLERDPTKRIVLGSYNDLLAQRFSRKVRRLCEPRMVLSSERSAVCDWETEAGGGLRAVGTGAGITGFGADLLVIDDPVKSREEAGSAAFRERVWTWYTDDLLTRLEPNAAVVLVMTHWHLDDLAGRILASEEASRWTVVQLPALAEAGDPLGRAEGAGLWPDRYDEAALLAIKTALGSSSFEALYQQRPSAAGGAIFKREWWRFYREAPAFGRLVVQSWDTAFKAGNANDFSVCTTWRVTDAGYFLIDCWKRRVEFPLLKTMVRTLGEQYRPSVVLVEDKASGQSLVQELQRDTRLPILPISVDADKIARAYAVTPTIETGRVCLPESAPWLGDFLDELSAFPNAAYDDTVDSVTQALSYMINYRPRRAVQVQIWTGEEITWR